MGKTFRLLFNLYPGEWKKVSFFIVLAFLWSVGGYGTFALSEGLFLEHVGAESLPQTYLVIAVSMCLLSAILIFCLNRLPIRRILFCIIGLWISTNLLFYCLLPQDRLSLWFAFKVTGWIIPISTYIIYWAFIDLYFDLQDAKRLFSLFNSITFLGDALGGGLIASLLKIVGFQGLILIFTLFLAGSLLCICWITRSHKSLVVDLVDHHHATSHLSFHDFIQMLKRSKFTLFLLFFYFSMQVLAIVTEFNYMNSFENAFVHKPENDLTEFMGTCSMWISLGNMLFGMLCYSRILKRIGIHNIIVTAPICFLFIFLLWNCKEALSIAVFAMVAREGIVYSIDDNNLNLLVAAVPTKIKNQVRVSVESFFEPVGMFSGALLLCFMHCRAHLLGLQLAIIALIVVLFLRRQYAQALFRNLVANAIRFEKKAIDWIVQFSKKEQKNIELLLFSKLKQPKEAEQLLACEYLLKMALAKALPRILDHLGKLSLPGKLKAIALLETSRWAQETIVIERLERWYRVLPHPSLKSAIHLYFARHGLIRPERVIDDLQSDHLGLRTAAIITFMRKAHASQFPSLHSVASEQLHQLLHSSLEEELCAGIDIVGLEKNPLYTDRLLAFLKYPSLAINRSAAQALAEGIDSSQKLYTKAIIAQLTRTQDAMVRLSCLEAIEKVADSDSIPTLILAAYHFRPMELKAVEKIALSMGPSLAEELLALTIPQHIPDKCRLLAGKILGKLNRKLLRKALNPIIQAEIKRAYFYFYHACEIQKQRPEHDLSLLENALHTSYRTIVDFIIQLLGVAGSLEESDILAHTLHSRNRKIRAQALESLEKTCEPHIFAKLGPLIYDKQPEERIRYYLKSGGLPHTLTQLLDVMQYSSSPADQIIAIGLKARLKTSDWRDTLQQKMREGSSVVHYFAHELLEIKV